MDEESSQKTLKQLQLNFPQKYDSQKNKGILSLLWNLLPDEAVWDCFSASSPHKQPLLSESNSDTK